MSSAYPNSQYARNTAVARYEQMPYLTELASSRSQKLNQRVLDQPLFYWDDAFLTNRKLLIEFLRQISDSMALSVHPLMGSHNANNVDIYDAVRGKLNKRDYDPLLRLFGEESAVGVKDNHFFHGGEKTLTAQILRQPFDFRAQNISTEFARQSILDDSKKGAEIGVQGMIQQLLAEGEGGVAPLRNPKVKLPRTGGEYLDMLTGQEQVEAIITKLLRHTDRRHDFQDIGRKASYHKFRINAEFAFVDVENGEVIPRILHPMQVRWLAGKAVETLTDPAVLAVQVSDYMTPTELKNRLGTKLNTGTGIEGVRAYVNMLLDSQGGRSYDLPGYDRHGGYWNEMGQSTGALMGSDARYGITAGRSYTAEQRSWMNALFYPTRQGNRMLTNLRVERNFFTMQREKRFSVERISRSGQRTPATDRELKNWLTDGQRGVLDYEIDYSPVANDTPLTGRDNIKTYTRPEMWAFTRIGHDAFVDIGPYRYQPSFDEDTTDRARTNWPVVAQISYEKSMATLGRNDAVRADVLMQKIDMFMAGLGYEDALVIDDAQQKDPISYRYNAKMSGLIRIDSTKYQMGNPAALKNLSVVKLSNETQQIQELFAMVAQRSSEYRTRIGAGDDVSGMASPYQSGKQQQMNIAGQKLLNVEYNFEHTKFMNALLQCCADVCKFHYAKDEQITVLGEREREVLMLTSKLSLADYAIYLQSGQVMADKKQALDQLTSQLMQSGGAEDAEALMQIILSDNPAQGYAEYRKIRAGIVERQQAQAEQQNELAKAQMADNQEERKLKITLEQMKIDSAERIQKMKMDEQRERENFKGEMTDIKNNNDRDDTLLDAQLTEEQNQQAHDQQLEQDAFNQALQTTTPPAKRTQP